MLDAAVEVFSRNGFHPASMDEIADVAGVSKPMIYAYLGSKDELFSACIHREANRMMARITAAVPAGLAPDERLYRGLLAFFEFIAEYRDGWIVLYRQARVQGTFAAQITAVRERIIMLVAELLAGTADEAARTHAMPTAYALVGAAEALSDWAVEHPEHTPQHLTSRLMDLVWTGLGGMVQGKRWISASAP